MLRSASWVRAVGAPSSRAALSVRLVQPQPRISSCNSFSTTATSFAEKPVSFSDAHFRQDEDKERIKQDKRRAQRAAADAADAGSSAAQPPPRAAAEEGDGERAFMKPGNEVEHAVISVFDLLSIGIGPSSSHTLGPLRAGSIYANDLLDAGLLHSVARLQIHLYGSLAATGEGHMTPLALLIGLEGYNAETVDTQFVPKRYEEICETHKLKLGHVVEGAAGGKEIEFDIKKDLKWMWGEMLPLHSNGLRMTVFDEAGDMLASNDFYSIVASSSMANMSTGSSAREAGDHPSDVLENAFYKSVRKADAADARRTGVESHASAPKSRAISLSAPEATTVESEEAEVVDGLSESDARALTSGSSSSASAPVKTSSTSPKGAPKVPFVFWDGASLLALTRKHNMTIAQIMWENEITFTPPEEVRAKLLHIWETMDNCIREGVHNTEAHLPGPLRLRRRAPGLYARLTRGFYADGRSGRGAEGPSISAPGSDSGGLAVALGQTGQPHGSAGYMTRTRSKGPPHVHGRFDHPIVPIPPRRTTFPSSDFLSCYAIAVNEVNATGGRVVVAPTLGAAGVLPSVLKYITEFISEDEERDIMTYLLTAAAIGMLIKRGATISAAEGGCMAEIGSACAMAAGAFAACMGASPEVIEHAAEIGIEHNLGLTCDPIGGMVQAPCIERNALGAVKAVVSAQLALASGDGIHSVSLDAALAAMRSTARGMRHEFKESSLAGLAVSVKIPVSMPEC